MTAPTGHTAAQFPQCRQFCCLITALLSVRSIQLCGQSVRQAPQPQKVTIANSPWLFGLLFPDLPFKFKEKYPNIELDLVDRSDTEVLQYVLDDPTHLGLIAEPKHWHGRHTHFSTVKTYALQLCLHKAHPLAKRESVSFGDLKDEKFLLLDKSSFYQQIVKDKSEEYGFMANIAYETADIHQLCSLADNNKGVLICVPVTPHNLFHNLIFVPFSDKDMTFSVAFSFKAMTSSVSLQRDSWSL